MTVADRTTATTDALDAIPPHLRELAGRIMAAMVTSMRGGDAYWTTADLAARVGIKPRTAERDELNSALSALQRTRGPRLMHYEHSYGGPLEWQLTGEGIEVARSLSTGVSGAQRSAAGRRNQQGP